MSSENTRIAPNFLYPDLLLAKEIVYNKLNLALTDFKEETESREYNASLFKLNKMVVTYRASKITPTKTGQFVTIWKRNKNGITEPFDSLDNFDLLIIAARSGDNIGQFIFPKTILADKKIITHNGKEGKRGIRVYPPWDIANNKQAEKTQSWQTNYFLSIKADNSTDLELAKRLFAKESLF